MALTNGGARLWSRPRCLGRIACLQRQGLGCDERELGCEGNGSIVRQRGRLKTGWRRDVQVEVVGHHVVESAPQFVHAVPVFDYVKRSLRGGGCTVAER
jgi:hypothetical protein